MELNVVKKTDDTLMVECRGETVTLTEALREYLWDVGGVVEAAQIKEHPYLSEPKIFVKSEKDPKEALEKAAEKILDDIEAFKREFKNALKV